MQLPGLPVLEIDTIVRRTLRGSVVVATIIGAIAWVLGQPFVIPGLVIGLVCAVFNHRLFQATAVRYTSTEGEVERKPFAGATLVRLGACTAVAIVLLILAAPVGWGVIIALAVFQFVMMVNSLLALRAHLSRDRMRDG